MSDAIAEDHFRLAGAQVYAAWPPPTADAVWPTVQVLGVDPGDIHAEAFFTPEDNDARILEEVTYEHR